MALKAIFPSDKDSITVTGLYQWDYGQQLEIEAEGLPTVVEVHFSCTNMTEAIVRHCVFENGVGTVTIPDDCLEQSTPITAWIYEFAVTQGKTLKVITLPVIARTRPSVTREISEDDADDLSELITRLNQVVTDLENGAIKVKSAETAETAETVTGFTGTVESAEFATRAQKDWKDRVIHTTYVEKAAKKIYMCNFAGTQDVLQNSKFEIGSLPSDKSVNDIVGIGLEMGFDIGSDAPAELLKTPLKGLRFSAGKMHEAIVNPMTNNEESYFYSTAVDRTNGGGAATASMDVMLYAENGKLYLLFTDGFYSYVKNNSLDFGIYPLEDGGFYILRVCYWFA